MHTLVQLYLAAKRRGDLKLLAVISAVVHEKFPMPLAAVWWTMESVRIKGPDVSMEKLFADIRTTGVGPHQAFGEDVSQLGYLLGYSYLYQSGEYAEQEYDEFVVDEAYADLCTEKYLKSAR